MQTSQPPSTNPVAAATVPAQAVAEAPASRRKWVHKSRTYFFLYLLMFPTVASMAVFGYYPKIDVLIKSVYRWTPGQIEEYIGAKHYLDAFSDPIFWQSFKVVMIMLVANLAKMWPGIIVAIALHRLLSDRWRYIYQVCFVIPMVVPSMVFILVWKSFYDPDFGILNRFLNGTGLMHVLAWLDGTREAPGVMPNIAAALQPVITGVINPVFGSVWAMILFGSVLMTMMVQRRTETSRWVGYGFVLALAFGTPVLAVTALAAGPLLALILLAAFIGLLAGLAKGMGQGWIIWPFLVLFGIWGCYGDDLLWRLPLLLLAGILIAEVVFAKVDRLTAPEVLRWSGMSIIGIGTFFVFFGMIWTTSTAQFTEGTPAWLGNKDLILPSLIMWGFPWVGTVGVLIYLAGLQQISTDVYEAAELDGVGPVGKLFKIELPLIMTQVRINLIMMTIATLTGYEFFLILLGRDGGPGNVGMVPGLYMYRSAFVDLKYGYACALGMVLFVIILLLTVIYQKYVKVDK